MKPSLFLLKLNFFLEFQFHLFKYLLHQINHIFLGLQKNISKIMLPLSDTPHDSHLHIGDYLQFCLYQIQVLLYST